MIRFVDNLTPRGRFVLGIIIALGIVAFLVLANWLGNGQYGQVGKP